MTPDERAVERAAERLADLLAKIDKQARAIRSVGLQVPVLEADPPADSPTRMWILEDGRLRWRTAAGVVKEATLATPGGTTSGTPKPANPVVTRYRKTYKATWAQTYCAAHGQEGGGGNLHYGNRANEHGERRIMVGFDDTQIRADTAGSVIEKVSLRAINADAFGSRVEICWGGHKHSTAPSSYSAVRKNAYRGSWPKSGWGGGLVPWRTIPKLFGTALRDDTIRGLTVDQPAGVTYSGQINWPSIELAVVYRK